MKVFVIAGEPSGDALGGALMQGLKALRPDIKFEGVGGPLMQAEGLVSRFDMSELSLMGLAEVLPKYFHLKRRIRETAQAVIKTKPDVLITIDSPDFCLRVAGMVKAASDIRTVHYVAPTVWAWRPKRAAKMAKMIDQVLALFPFEPPYMEAEGIRCDFVGHPVVTSSVASSEDASAFRLSHGIGSDSPMVLVLPGSRMGEVTRLSDCFAGAMHRYKAEHSEAHFIIPAAAPVAQWLQDHRELWPADTVILDPRDLDPNAADQMKRAAFAAADMALAASGTVSLELAAAGTPMVIAYEMNWLSRQIISRMLLTDTVTLVNLVSDTRVVPEFIGAACQPVPIAAALNDVMNDPAPQLEAMAKTMDLLGQGFEPPGLRAARAVLDGLTR